MCFPFCIWSNTAKVHPRMKKNGGKKVQFVGFRYRGTFVK